MMRIASMGRMVIRTLMTFYESYATKDHILQKYQPILFGLFRPDRDTHLVNNSMPLMGVANCFYDIQNNNVK